MANARSITLVAMNAVHHDARTLNLARSLVDAGFDVTVIASGTMDGVRMHTWTDPGGSAYRRWRSFNAFASSISTRASLVIGMDLFALQAASRLARRSSALLWYDMREFYFSLGPLQGKGWKQRVIAAHERRLLRRVDQVLVSGYLDAKIVRERFQLSTPPHILLNTPPLRERVVSNYLRETFSISNADRVALYQGVVHHGRGIVPFLDAMDSLPDVHLCVVGDGPARTQLQQQARERGLSARVHWHDAVPYDALHTITCSADVGLCLIEPISESYRYALPNKLFEYMMAGLPVLATDLPALHEQLVRIPAGILVNQGLTPHSIVDAWNQLMVPATYDAMQQSSNRVHKIAYHQQASEVLHAIELALDT